MVLVHLLIVVAEFWLLLLLLFLSLLTFPTLSGELSAMDFGGVRPPPNAKVHTAQRHPLNMK